MRILPCLLLLACPGSPEDSDPPTQEEAPNPGYVCQGNPETPCSFDASACPTTLGDCQNACAQLAATTCAADGCADAGDPATFLCGIADLAVQQCLATCGGMQTANCSQITEWVCADRYDTCDDVNACWAAGVGE